MTQDPGSGSPMSERMQSLLSRAVEDQLSEQRQLAGALTEVRAQLAQLGTQLEGIHTGSGDPGLEAALGAVAADVREAVRLLGERLDGVGRLVQQRGHDLAEQRAAIAELKAAVDGHTNALGGMTGGLAALPAFGERIDALHSGLGGLADRLRGLEELAAAVGALQQRSDSLDDGLRELRQAFSGVAARAAQLPGREDVESITGRVVESVDGLGGRLSRLETAVPSLLERLDGLADMHAGVQESLTTISASLAERPSTTGPGPAVGDAGDVAADLAAIREHLEATAEAEDADMQALTERLDAVHDGLLGPAGLAARLGALEASGAGDAVSAPEVDADKVEALVSRAVAESERRLADHVDEAILTLAEALLRRRGSRARPSGLSAVLGPGEVDSATGDAAVEAAAATPADLREDSDPEELDEADEARQDEDEDEGEDDDEGGTPTTRWQTPTAVEPAAPAADEVAEQPRKRKPWWRPGG